MAPAKKENKKIKITPRINEASSWLLEKASQDQSKPISLLIEEIINKHFGYDNIIYLNIEYLQHRKIKDALASSLIKKSNCVFIKQSGGAYVPYKIKYHWSHRCFYAVDKQGKYFTPITRPISNIEYHEKEILLYTVKPAKIVYGFRAETVEDVKKEVEKWAI